MQNRLGVARCCCVPCVDCWNLVSLYGKFESYPGGVHYEGPLNPFQVYNLPRVLNIFGNIVAGNEVIRVDAPNQICEPDNSFFLYRLIEANWPVGYPINNSTNQTPQFTGHYDEGNLPNPPIDYTYRIQIWHTWSFTPCLGLEPEPI